MVGIICDVFTDAIGIVTATRQAAAIPEVRKPDSEWVLLSVSDVAIVAMRCGVTRRRE